MNQLTSLHVGYETQVLVLKKRLAKVHRIITAGGLWPITKGHVSCRVPGTNHVFILGHIHAEGRSPERPNVTVAPHYEGFATAEGEFVALGIVYEDHVWRRFCEIMELPAWRDWNNDERIRRYDEIREELAEPVAGFSGVRSPGAP